MRRTWWEKLSAVCWLTATGNFFAAIFPCQLPEAPHEALQRGRYGLSCESEN